MVSQNIIIYPHNNKSQPFDVGSRTLTQLFCKPNDSSALANMTGYLNDSQVFASADGAANCESVLRELLNDLDDFNTVSSNDMEKSRAQGRQLSSQLPSLNLEKLEHKDAPNATQQLEDVKDLGPNERWLINSGRVRDGELPLFKMSLKDAIRLHAIYTHTKSNNP